MNGLILMMAKRAAGLRVMLLSELLVVGAMFFGFVGADVEVVAALLFEGVEAEVMEDVGFVLELNLVLVVLLGDLYGLIADIGGEFEVAEGAGWVIAEEEVEFFVGRILLDDRCMGGCWVGTDADEA